MNSLDSKKCLGVHKYRKSIHNARLFKVVKKNQCIPKFLSLLPSLNELKQTTILYAKGGEEKDTRNSKWV